MTYINLLVVVLCLWLPHSQAQIAIDDAVVFITSTSFDGDLASSQPCANAVMSGTALTAYQSASFSVFPMVADATHDYNELLAGINNIYDSSGATSNYNWADTITNTALGSMLFDENGIQHSSALSFWSGANNLVHAPTTDCFAFSTNYVGDTGYTTHASFSVGLQSIQHCGSAQRVLCAITHEPSATPSVSIAPSVVIAPSVSTAPSVSAAPSVSVAPSVSAAPSVSVTPSHQVCSRL
jgi:hypothetical protein